MPLTLDGVSHAYRPGQWILRGIDLEVGVGEAVALLGPSGSGKTTLLSIMGLLQTPAAGTVALDGRPVVRLGRVRLRSEAFAWVFQTVNVVRRRTALDNAAVGLLARGMTRSEAESAAAGALGDVGLADLALAAVQQLSGGELQRVCIARAAAVRPRFLLCDEPTGQLDSSTSARVLDALWAARRPETAIVIATHDPSVVARCDRVLRLVDGEVVSG